MEGKTQLTFEVSNIPEEVFKKFGVESGGANYLNNLVYELLRLAVNASDKEAVQALYDYVTIVK